MTTFSEQLKLLIANESVNSFAKKCELSESGIRSYLQGTLPKIDAAIKIANANSVSLDWLISGGNSLDAGMSDNEQSSFTYDDGSHPFRYIPHINLVASSGDGDLAL